MCLQNLIFIKYIISCLLALSDRESEEVLPIGRSQIAKFDFLTVYLSSKFELWTLICWKQGQDDLAILSYQGFRNNIQIIGIF